MLVAGMVAGGVGRHVAQLARGLTAAGVPVVIACPEVVSSRFDLAETGADLVAIEIGNRPHPLRDRATVATLRQRAADCRVVHAHGLRAGALSVMACEAAQGPPVLVTLHNAAPQGRVAAAVHHGLERLVCARATLVLAVSEDLQHTAAQRGADCVDRAVVAASRADPVRSRAEVRAELGLQPSTLLVVTVGRLAAQKGFDRLLEVAAHPTLRGLDYRVVIAGDGPQHAQLSRRVQRESLPVTLLGHRGDVPDLLGAADLAISTARWEGQPVWLQEALSVGVPIVATDVGGTGQVIGDGGDLVADDPEALRAALYRALTDSDHRARLRSRAVTRAGELPTEADSVQAALAAYTRVEGPAAVPPPE